jgi:peptidyl-prolyl cis-trans isomerase C
MPRAALLVLFSVALGAVAGCRRDTGARTASGPAVPLVAAPASGADDVVATVDGRPIRASEVALQARVRGVDARQALRDLVDAEVLAGAAAARGLDRDRAVIEAVKQEMVRRWLAVEFEPKAGPDAIPERLVRRTYNRNVNLFDHSEYVDVWHILTPVAKNATPEQKAAARADAEELAEKAKGLDEAAFKALATTKRKSPGDPFRLERIITARDGWTVKEFSYPAHDLLKKPGDVSPVVETSYGYHVIFLVKRIPPVHMTVAEAAPKIREGLLADFQRLELVRRVDELMHAHAVMVRPERIPATSEREQTR